ncbi:MAG TPA: pitrilysin family protein [Vicinamibacterales bacterium]|nr:pitrilysin family protein [Vicinamibacterales bacterium]
MRDTAVAGLAPVRDVLSNGARVIVQETSFSPSVTISASFRAGGLYEPAGLPGLAWFLGRVIDRGTADRSAGQIAETLDESGVALKVSVNRHTLALSCTCLSEDFETILAVMADVARRPAFPEAEIEKRRAEIITSIRQDDDNPAVCAHEALQRLLYGGEHPYGRPGKGTIAGAEAVTRDALRAFHAGRFAPAALSLAIVGDVPPARALACAGDVLGDWDAPAPPERAVPPVPHPSARQCVVVPMREKPQSDIAYGFVTIARLDPSYYACWMLNNILGQFGIGGRLAENIRERQGMAYYAFSAFDPSVGPGPLVVRAGVDPRNVDRAVAAIDYEVAVLADGGPTDQEVEETRQFLVGSIPRLLETNQSIAAFLQTSEFFGLGPDYDRRLPGLIEAVTREDIEAAGRAILEPSRAAVAVAGPVPAEP